MREYTNNLIGGERQEATGDWLQLSSPHTGEIDRRVRLGGPADVAAAILAARRALPAWRATSPAVRAERLEALADALEARADELTAAIMSEVGTPERIARAVQVGLAITDARTYAAATEGACASTRIGHSVVYMRPLGVVAALTPWNYPLHQVIAKIGAALSAGCTVVLKPSELVPATNNLLAELLQTVFPAGVVNIVQGGKDVGEALIAGDIDAISFTGSTETGSTIARVAAERHLPCALEMGGKSPSIVLPDADVDAAVRSSLSAGWLNSGQTCTALTRLLIHESQLEAAKPIVQSWAEKMETRLGPLISQSQFDRVQGYIERGVADGTELWAGGPGRLGEDGWRVRPTVFVTRDPHHELVRDEIFGPVISVQPYSDVDEAIALANDTPFGLAAAVWGGQEDEIERVISSLAAGQIDVNGAAFNPAAPFGGFGASGSARELGSAGIAEFQRPVSVQRSESDPEDQSAQAAGNSN